MKPRTEPRRMRLREKRHLRLVRTQAPRRPQFEAPPDTTTLGPCFCGHPATAHGRCACAEPRECTDHLGVCEWCGCSIYEEAR